MKKRENTGWGKVANWYNNLIENDKNNYQTRVILPNLLRILNIKKGDKILDIACGQGFFSRAFHELGAKVTGIDISSELIAHAQKHSSPEIDYQIGTAHDLGKIVKENMLFDKAVIVLALQNMDEINKILEEINRKLTSHGTLVIVLNHPCFRIPAHSSWQWDKETNRQYRRIDTYMSEKEIKIDMTPGESDERKKKYTISFHRPLQVYFKALKKNNFSMVACEEWISDKHSAEGPRASEEDRVRKEIPLFFCLEARKNV